MIRDLHIISFDVPYPADYGGVAETFATIQSLHRHNIKIHLHCFEYGRGQQPELTKYCSSVNYYDRRTGYSGLSSRMPYIVSSRTSAELNRRLQHDDHPILMEGIHCSSIALEEGFSNRRLHLRCHNVEHLYYRQLANTTRSLFKKIYYLSESRLLKKYESTVAPLVEISAMSEQDAEYFRTQLNSQHVTYIPAFVPFDHVNIETGAGAYCLYHGNLSVPENEAAAYDLLTHVFNDLQIPLVIAGRNPSARLRRAARKTRFTCLVADPSSQELSDMIRKAQINVLPSYNHTGVKMKLLNALFNGRHCITNSAAVSGSSLGELCHIADNINEVRSAVRNLFEQPFTHSEIGSRESTLNHHYSNDRSAEKLITLLW